MLPLYDPGNRGKCVHQVFDNKERISPKNVYRIATSAMFSETELGEVRFQGGLLLHLLPPGTRSTRFPWSWALGTPSLGRGRASTPGGFRLMATQRLTRVSTEEGARSILRRMIDAGRCTVEDLDKAPPGHINPQAYRNLMRDIAPQPKVEVVSPRDLASPQTEQPLPF